MGTYSSTAYQSLMRRDSDGGLEHLFGSDQNIIDLAELGALVLEIGSSAPSNTDRLWLDSTPGSGSPGDPKYHNGSSWVALDKSGFIKHLWNNGFHNFSATAAPSATSDAASGYAVGSLWFDVSNDRIYACVDSTASAAVWKEMGDSLLYHGDSTDADPSGSGARLWWQRDRGTLSVYDVDISTWFDVGGSSTPVLYIGDSTDADPSGSGYKFWYSRDTGVLAVYDDSISTWIGV